MVFALRKKSRAEHAIAFEVGSGSVGAAIIRSDSEADSPVILYATREFLSLKQTAAVEDIRKRLLTTFMSLTLEVSQTAQKLNLGGTRTTVVVSFTAPWAHTRHSTSTIENETPFVITDKTIAHATTQAEASAPDTAELSSLTTINRNIHSYSVNNYSIKNPIGQTGTSLTLNETVSAVATEIYTAVDEVINKVFDLPGTLYITSALIQQYVLQSSIKTPDWFGTIHFTHEAVELTLYQNNEIKTAHTTPIGINTIARNIATTTKIPHEQIYRMLVSDGEAVLTADLVETVTNAFADTIALPLGKFLADVHAQDILPQEIYLVTSVGHSSLLHKYTNDTLKKSIKKKFTLTNLLVANHSATGNTEADAGLRSIAYFFHNTR